MTDPRTARRPVAAPTVAPPPLFVERRVAFRRAADRRAHEETRLLARSLDVLAGGDDAEARLAGLLDLLAQTVGAERAAVVADAPERRVAVAADGESDREAALALARWLDAAAPRTRARRAAAPPAEIAVAIRARRKRGRATRPAQPAPRDAAALDEGSRALLPIPSAGDVTLGFAFARPVDDTVLADRLPPAMARHAAVALSLVTGTLATQRALTALQARDDERQRFVSTVAHELRTPLTGLGGYLDLILDGRVDDRAVEREFLERGRTIVGSMAELVGDLMELSRLESGTLSLDFRPFSIAETIATVHAALVPLALARGLELRATPPPRLRAALGDRRRVEQILTNLAANAVKFGGPAGGMVELAGWFDGSVAVVVVRDEGAGIEPDDRVRIFDRFYRMAAHERITGTGLGLPIARELARTMGGELEVASQVGGGSSFVLALPGPGVADAAERIVATMGATIAGETERLRTIAFLRERTAEPANVAAATVADVDEARPNRLTDRAPQSVDAGRQPTVRLGRSVSAPAR